MELDYQKIYKKDEIQAMKEWFDNHELPQSMQIDAYTFSPDLRKTVNTLLKQALRFYDRPAMYGGVYILERIRAKILETENSAS
jgi:hypothetical protein